MSSIQTRLARISTVACAVALGLVIADAAFAQARVRERGNIAVTADVVSVDAEARKITLKNLDAEAIEYTVDPSATIMRGATDIKLGDLQKGWNVTVQGHENGTTRLLTYIKVMKAPEE